MGRSRTSADLRRPPPARGPRSTAPLLVALALIAAAAGMLVYERGSSDRIVAATRALVPDTAAWRALFQTLSELGNGVALFCIVVAIFVLRPAPRIAQNMILSAVLVGIVVHSLKLTIGRERPFDPARDSFPSGHSAIAAALAVCCLDAKRWVRVAAICLAALIAGSRFALLRHWPSDVLAGAGTGCALAALACRLPVTTWSFLTSWRVRSCLVAGAIAVLLFEIHRGAVYGHPLRLLLALPVLYAALRLIAQRSDMLEQSLRGPGQ